MPDVKLPDILEYENKLKAKLNARYQALAERLKSEPNIILRYEIKLSMDMLLEIYKELFTEE